MQQLEAPSFEALISQCQSSAVHLEMRDVYGIANEAERIGRWREGHRLDPADRASWWLPWHDLIAGTVARGVTIRRARIVSEPLSEYIRYEHSGTFKNVVSGEVVRWLPRNHASDLLLPGNDFWVFDDHTVRFGLFAGDGTHVGYQMNHDESVIRACVESFEAVWSRAIPHEDYKFDGC